VLVAARPPILDEKREQWLRAAWRVYAESERELGDRWRAPTPRNRVAFRPDATRLAGRRLARLRLGLRSSGQLRTIEPDPRRVEAHAPFGFSVEPPLPVLPKQTRQNGRVCREFGSNALATPHWPSP